MITKVTSSYFRDFYNDRYTSVITIEWVWDTRCGTTLYKGFVTLVKYIAHIYKAAIAGTFKNVCPSKFYGGVLISCHIVI